MTLWSHTLQVTTDDWYAEGKLGAALKIQGKPTEAMRHFSRALALNPDDAYANIEVAFWEHLHGNLPAAIEHYKKALSAAANNEAEIKIRAATNLGHVYRALGDGPSSEGYFARAADERQQQEQHQ